VKVITGYPCPRCGRSDISHPVITERAAAVTVACGACGTTFTVDTGTGDT
jgi:uncharacterized Zn finger protein